MKNSIKTGKNKSSSLIDLDNDNLYDIFLKAKEVIKSLLIEYQVDFLVKVLILLGTTIGVIHQVYFLFMIWWLRFFSPAQVLIDGFVIIWVTCISSLSIVLAYLLSSYIKNLKLSTFTKLIILLITIILSYLVYLKYIRYIELSLIKGFFHMFEVILLLITLLWFLPKRFLWWVIVGILTAQLVWNIFYNLREYWMVEITWKNYEIYYMNADYIITKERIIFDREGNKYTSPRLSK